MKKDDVVIFSYTRAQAIADGVLIDATELAKQAGFRYPVAVTAGVWAECVAVTEGVAGRTRRADSRLAQHASGSPSLGSGAGAAGGFRRACPERQPRGDLPLVHLYALCGPGDDAGAGRNRDASLGGLRPWETTQLKTYAGNLCGNSMRSRKGEPD